MYVNDMPSDVCEPDEIVDFVRGCIDTEVATTTNTVNVVNTGRTETTGRTVKVRR